MAYDANPWDSWWEFHGNLGGGGPTYDCLELADNPDFEFDSAEGEFVIGIMPTYTHVLGQEFILRHKDAYRMFTSYTGGDPGGNPRRLLFGVQCQPFAGWATATCGDTLFPAERMIAVGLYRPAIKRVNAAVWDSAGIIGGLADHFFFEPTTDPAEPVLIAANSTLTADPGYFKGRMYFFAWYKGFALTTPQLTDIYNGVANPADFNPTCYIDFSNNVEATYTSNIQTGPNAPYIWDVHGNPTQGSSATETEGILGHDFTVGLSTNQSLGHQFAVQIPTSQPLGHEFTVPRRPSQSWDPFTAPTGERLLRDLSKITRKKLG